MDSDHEPDSNKDSSESSNTLLVTCPDNAGPDISELSTCAESNANHNYVMEVDEDGDGWTVISC